LSFKSPPERWFGDILEAIALIDQFTSGMDFEAFRTNAMVVAAVERKLQIISEALSGLPMMQNGFVLPCRGAMFGVSETSSVTRMKESTWPQSGRLTRCPIA
jgi:hypothetical protein